MVFIWLLGTILGLFTLVVFRGAPYVPSHKKQLERAFSELVSLSAADTVVDLGAGDGIVLRCAANRGAKAIGYELNPILVWIGKVRFRSNSQVQIRLRDYLTLEKLPDETTLVYVFASGKDIKAIDRKMQQWSQKRPLQLISYGFEVPGKSPQKQLSPFTLYLYQ